MNPVIKVYNKADVAENQLIENVERHQLEVLTCTVANRVRAYHQHLRPIVNPFDLTMMMM